VAAAIGFSLPAGRVTGTSPLDSLRDRSFDSLLDRSRLVLQAAGQAKMVEPPVAIVRTHNMSKAEAGPRVSQAVTWIILRERREKGEPPEYSLIWVGKSSVATNRFPLSPRGGGTARLCTSAVPVHHISSAD
jgi:hypothetical protein